MSRVFRVFIEETLSKEFIVAADTAREAEAYVREKYGVAAEGFVLDYSHFSESDIIVFDEKDDLIDDFDEDELHHASSSV
jgi:hypothetical protein